MHSHLLTTLPGGERVITERVEGVRSASIGLWIGAGSRDETPTKAGVSHFIEHLLFKGTGRFDAVTIAELFDVMGGELNAATSRETTVVYTRVPDDHIDVALDVMTDMVFSPALTDIDSEREVVLEEIAMVDDNPQDLVHDLAAEAVFGTHPLGRPVIGEADVISSISRRSLLGYHRNAYTGPNVVLAAAGNVDHKRIAKALREHRKGSAPVAPLESAQARRKGLRADGSLPPQGHGAVPRLSRGPWDRARRSAPLRGRSARRDSRRLCVVTPVPGDPREAGNGVLGVHLRIALRGRRPGRHLRSARARRTSASASR